MSEQRLSAVEAKLDNVESQFGRLCNTLDRFTETMIRHDENTKHISEQLSDHEQRLRSVERAQIDNSGKIGTVWSIGSRVIGSIMGAAILGGLAYKLIGG